MPRDDALTMPWLFPRELIPTWLGPLILGPIAAPKPPLIPTGPPPPPWPPPPPGPASAGPLTTIAAPTNVFTMLRNMRCLLSCNDWHVQRTQRGAWLPCSPSFIWRTVSVDG